MQMNESEIRREVENAAKVAAMFNDVSKEQMFKLGFQYAVKMLKERIEEIEACK